MASVNILFSPSSSSTYTNSQFLLLPIFLLFFFSCQFLQFLQFLHTTPQKMHSHFAFAALSCLPLLVSATPLYATTYTTTATVKTHSVTVGGLDATGAPILRYNPESIVGDIGDLVQFVYLANNHTATQADFDTPCFPKEAGFNSGFRPNMVSDH